jgi:hypothetical protein
LPTVSEDKKICTLAAKKEIANSLMLEKGNLLFRQAQAQSALCQYEIF